MKTPKRMAQLVEALLANEWSMQIIHGTDTGGSPYVSIEARRGDERPVRATWHTRKTGTYRLFSCMVGQRDSTLAMALEVIEASKVSA